jgi:GNAT superfamily N-acetyltransferase
VAIRRAQAADRDSLLRLIQQFCEADRHPYDESRVDPALQPLLDDDTFGQVWIAGDDMTATGYAIVTWSYSLESGGRDCILDEIYSVSQSRGIGSELMNVVLDEAARAGARSIFLETESHNRRVREFYRRHGFSAEDSVWMSRSLA